MKVQNTNNKIITEQQNQPKKLSKAELEAKVKSKFGLAAKIKPKKAVIPEVKPELSNTAKKGVTNSSQGAFGDLAANDPSAPETQEKLKGLLKTGAFNFSERERHALAKILK